MTDHHNQELYKHQVYRYAQRLDIHHDQGAPEHVIRIYNCHQPSSIT